jgi:HlyD family secretion protein
MMPNKRESLKMFKTNTMSRLGALAQPLAIATHPLAASASILAVWALVAVLAAPGHSAAQDKAATPPAAGAKTRAALTVQAVSPVAASMPVTLPVSGNVAAWQEASIGSEASGLRVAELLADVGDTVRKGDVLARLADDTVRADLAQAEASLAETKALLAEAQANARRAHSLEGTGALSAQAISQFHTAEQTAVARVAAGEAAVAAQRLRLQHTEVKAPDGGTISARMATVGAVAGSGQELFRLIRGGRLEWRAEVPAVELVRVKPGQKVAVFTPGGQTVAAQVRKVAPTVDVATRNGLVYVDLLPGAGNELKPGMFARGEFRFDSRQVLTLPASALLLRDGFDVVMRIGPDQTVTQTKVQVVGRQADRVAVADLPVDARVVLRGAAFLTDGDAVKVVESDGKR